MARGLNKVMIIGSVERELETRYTADQEPVTSFGVATHRQWLTHAGERREESEWFNVVAWGNLARAAGQRLQRGQRVYVEGYLQTRKWEDAEGQQHFCTEVVAGRLISLDGQEAHSDGDFDAESEGMPRYLNRVVVIGNLGRDPEMRYTPHGQAVTSFSLAATRRWTTPEGEHKTATDWFNVISWGNLAEICNRYLTKGRRVYVEGELRTRRWDAPDGKMLFRTELVAGEMIMLGPRLKTQEAQDASNNYSNKAPY
jgi:single-strand DNA-binding protein